MLTIGNENKEAKRLRKAIAQHHVQDKRPDRTPKDPKHLRQN